MSIAHLPESLYTLRPALFKLAVWLYTHYAGETAELSHRAIAEAVRLSESTVSDGMAELATLGHITRTWDRGRYLTSVPGDRGLPEGIADYGSGSLSDPTEAGDRSAIPPAAQGSRTRQARAGDRHSIPPAHKEVLESDQESDLLTETDLDSPRARELDAALAADDCNHRLRPKILAANPALTLAEYQQQRARIPPGCTVGLLFAALADGRRLPPLADGDRAIDPATLSYGGAYRRGDDLDDLDPALLRRYLSPGVTHAA